VTLFDVSQLECCLEAGQAAVHAHESELIRLHDKAARACPGDDRHIISVLDLG